MKYPNLSGNEFKNIVNLFKLIVIMVTMGLTILVSVALFVSYKDIASMRTDLRNQTNDMKLEIFSLKEFSQKEIKNAQDYSIQQIRIIKEEAVTQAQLSAKLKIQEIFEDSKMIREMIEETAEEILYTKLKDILDEQISETVEIFRSQVQIIPDLISATDRIRAGSRKALIYVDSLRTNAENNYVKEFAEEIYQSKKEDYKNSYENDIDKMLLYITNMKENAIYLNRPPIFLLEKDIKKWQNPEKRDEIIATLIKTIREDDDLNKIAMSFFIIKKWTEIDIELFDFKDFEEKIKQIEK